MNYLLSSLPNDVSQRLLRRAEKVELARGTVLHEPYEQPRYAHFPLRGVCSVVTRTRSGHAIETGMLGNESCTTATHVMGGAEVPSQYIQQVPGISLRIPFTDLKTQFQESEAVRSRFLELVQVWSLSMGQMVACQRLHHAEQRLSRWLLMARQRADCDTLHLSHEFLAEMLGCGRPKVTLLLLEFREAGLVDSERGGLLKIRDVTGLEANACECHDVISSLYANLYQTATSAGDRRATS